MTWRSEDIASSTKRLATKTIPWTYSRFWNTVFSTHSLQASELVIFILSASIPVKVISSQSFLGIICSSFKEYERVL